jgi:transcriptional regulator
MPGSDLFTGTLEILALKALTWGPRHGYAIGRWIRETTGEALDIQEGALYPALHRVARKGLVAEEWGLTDTGREAKFYALTPAGRKHLAAESKRWTVFATAVTHALALSRA